MLPVLPISSFNFQFPIIQCRQCGIVASFHLPFANHPSRLFGFPEFRFFAPDFRRAARPRLFGIPRKTDLRRPPHEIPERNSAKGGAEAPPSENPKCRLRKRRAERGRPIARGGGSANRGSRFRWKSIRTRRTCRHRARGDGDDPDRRDSRARTTTTRTIRSAFRRRRARGGGPVRTDSRVRRTCYCSVCISCSWGGFLVEA